MKPLLTWNDLSPLEREAAREQYICIREDEEQKPREQLEAEGYNWDFVKECRFGRTTLNGETNIIVFI